MENNIVNAVEELRGIMVETCSILMANIQTLTVKVDSLERKIDTLNMQLTARNIPSEPTRIERKPLPPTGLSYNGPNSVVESRDDSIGTCKYGNKKVKFYGTCHCCNRPIVQSTVVSFCNRHNMEHTCFSCQHDTVDTIPITNIVYHNQPSSLPMLNTPNTPPVIDKSVTLKCEICGNPRTYKDVLDYNKKRQNALALGLPPVMCEGCAKKRALLTMSAPVVPPVKAPVTPVSTPPVKAPMVPPVKAPTTPVSTQLEDEQLYSCISYTESDTELVDEIFDTTLQELIDDVTGPYDSSSFVDYRGIDVFSLSFNELIGAMAKNYSRPTFNETTWNQYKATLNSTQQAPVQQVLVQQVPVLSSEVEGDCPF